MIQGARGIWERIPREVKWLTLVGAVLWVVIASGAVPSPGSDDPAGVVSPATSTIPESASGVVSAPATTTPQPDTENLEPKRDGAGVKATSRRWVNIWLSAPATPDWRRRMAEISTVQVADTMAAANVSEIPHAHIVKARLVVVSSTYGVTGIDLSNGSHLTIRCVLDINGWLVAAAALS